MIIFEIQTFWPKSENIIRID